jgi:hypothetical protein
VRVGETVDSLDDDISNWFGKRTEESFVETVVDWIDDVWFVRGC